MQSFTASELLDSLEAGKVEYRPKPWGQEVVVTTDVAIFKIITVNEGARTSLQYHKEKDELCVLLEGAGGVVIDEDGMTMPSAARPAQPLRIHPGTVHRALGPTTFLEVTSLKDDDVVRLEDDYNR